MRKFLSLVIVIMSAMVSVSAQASAQAVQAGQNHKQYFEGKNVSVRIDKNATGDTDEDASYLRRTSYSYPADEFKPGVVQVGPRTTYLKEGLSTEEVVRLLGKPSAISQRSEKDMVVTIYEFPRSEGRVLVAEFVKDALVRSTMERRGQVAQADR